MTQEEILQGNKLLATFMGVKIGEDLFSYRIGVTQPLHENNLNYHDSWGWLMPVWYKFRDLKVTDSINQTTLQGIKYMFIQKMANASIIDAFEQLVYGVEWYNENKDIHE